MRKWGIRKWSVVFLLAVAGYFTLGYVLLSIEKLEGKTCLPTTLQHKLHWDYPHGLRWVSRSKTSWCMVQPPTLVLGNQTNYHAQKGLSGPEAIPARGSWQLSFVQVREKFPFFLPYFAMTTSGGWHWRVGCRWDQSDGYYTFPSGTIKRVR